MMTLAREAILRAAGAVRDRIVWVLADAARLVGAKRLGNWIETGGGPRPVK
jgi:hypothetical protein